MDDLLSPESGDDSADTKKSSQGKLEQTEAVAVSLSAGDDDDKTGDSAQNHAETEGEQGPRKPSHAASIAMSFASPRPMPSRRRTSQ